MRKLDENKVYDLSELTRGERKVLLNYLKRNFNNWKNSDDFYKKWCLYFSDYDNTWYQGKIEPTANAIELFYTLENVQVDCRDLTYDQIDEMLSVVGDKLDPLNSSFDVDKECIYFSFNKYCKLFGFYEIDEEQYEISYEKFMELFGNKEKPKEILTLENVQVDCRALTEYQIKEMASVFEKNGYKIFNPDDDLVVNNNFYFLNCEDGYYMVYSEYIEKTTITYEKFMELFTGQVADVGGMVVEKPKHYFEYTDTFARMEANCTIEECLAFAKGSIDSYNWSTKEQSKEDFEKIISYANWVVRLILLYVSKDEIIKWLEEEGNKLK